MSIIAVDTALTLAADVAPLICSCGCNIIYLFTSYTNKLNSYGSGGGAMTLMIMLGIFFCNTINSMS